MIPRITSTLKNLLQPFGASFLLFTIALCYTSCKEEALVDLNVQPKSDLLNVRFDTNTVVLAHTYEVDGIRTDETITQEYTTDALIGTYIDPVFGTTSASLYTQLLSNTDAPPLGTSPVVDAVTLVLVYNSFVYGSSIAGAQNISVYRLAEGMSTDNDYYENTSLLRDTTDLASAFSFVPVAEGGQLSIPLNTSIGSAILNGNLATNADFQNVIKGLYITTENTTGLLASQGNILSFEMENAETQLKVYYHNAENTIPSTSGLSYSFNTVARFSTFTHDYTSAHAELASQLSSSVVGQNERVFIQGIAGTKVKITFPDLMSWLDSGDVGINAAELVIKKDAAFSTSSYAPPAQLVVYGINADGSLFELDDANEGEAYFDGNYNTTSFEYRFNIARYIQQVLSGEKANNGLYLGVLNASVVPNRIIVGGGDGNYRMKLNITRTK